MTSTRHDMGKAASFIAASRRRLILLAALRSAFAAAIVNETVRWLGVGYNIVFNDNIPPLNIGPLFFLVFFAVQFRSWSVPAVAARLDASLSFKDRLASLVDFAGREDVDPVYREAQSREVDTSLKDIPAAAGVRLHRVLWFGPVLLLVSMLYPYATFPLPSRAPQQVARRGAVPPDPAASAPGRSAERKKPGLNEHPPPGAEGTEPAETDADKTRKGSASPLPGGAGQEDASAPSRARKGRPPQNAAERQTPIVSQRVGKDLSKVVDPLFTPGSKKMSAPKELPGGTMSFRLVPRAAPGKGSVGSASTADSAPRAVTVDFDSIPEQYREIVRQYFAYLAGEGKEPVREN